MGLELGGGRVCSDSGCAPTLCLPAGGGEAAAAQLEEARRALLGAEPAPSAPASTAAAAVVDVSDHHYESLKVKELQEALRGRGLPTSGRKAELLQRLQAWVADPKGKNEAAMNVVWQ